MKTADAVGTDIGGDLAGLREQNLRRILGALLGSRQGLSQPRLIELTGLSRSTVSSLLTHHLADVLRSGARRNGENSGRPLKAWSLDPSACYSIGVDIGQKHVSAVLVDLLSNVLAGPIREAMPNTLDDPHRTLAMATDLVATLVDAEKIACEKIAAITVGLPGPVDQDSGVMVDGATRAWAGIDVRDEIRKRWVVGSPPKRLTDNKANLGALAEHRFGAGRGAESLLFLDWSEGVGAGLVLDGRVWRGYSGIAGEIGHLAVTVSADDAEVLGLPEDRAEWKSCKRCGQISCLDRVAGGFVVSAAAGLPNLSEVVRVALGKTPSKGRENARSVLEVAATLIGTAIGPAITLLNLDRVIIGGAVGEPLLYPLLAKRLSQGIEESAFNCAWSDASLEIGSLGLEAPVVGAATLGLDEFGIDFLIRRAQAASSSAEGGRILASS